MMTRWAILQLTSALVLLGACTSSLDGAPCPCVPGWCCWEDVCRPESECQVKIAFVPKASDNPVFRVAYAGANQAANELNSVVGGPRVEMACVSPPSLDSNEQRAAVKQAIDSRPSGLIVSCLDPSVITPVIDDAAAMGIPVITFDSDCPLANRMGFYGIDNEQSGMKAADLLVDAMVKTQGPNQKSVAILTGGASAVNLKGRVDGFTARLSNLYRDVQVITPISSCDETAERCGQAIEQIIAAHPALDGLFITGLWGLQAACSCDQNTGVSCNCADQLMPNWKAAAKGKLRTVSYDTFPFELALMRQNYLSALISQNYRSWGYNAVTLMFQYLTQAKRAKNFVDSEFEIYTNDGPIPANLEAEALGPELSSVCDSPLNRRSSGP